MHIVRPVLVYGIIFPIHFRLCSMTLLLLLAPLQTCTLMSFLMVAGTKFLKKPPVYGIYYIKVHGYIIPATILFRHTALTYIITCKLY